MSDISDHLLQPIPYVECNNCGGDGDKQCCDMPVHYVPASLDVAWQNYWRSK